MKLTIVLAFIATVACIVATAQTVKVWELEAYTHYADRTILDGFILLDECVTNTNNRRGSI